MDEEKLFSELEEEIGYCFQDKMLLELALTHTTFAYEAQEKPIRDNQRLEFLGDSVLGMVVAEYLYENYPESSEGEMTQSRAALVNRNSLAMRAKKLNLSVYLLLGKGEKKLGGRRNFTNLAGALEAVIGAIYLDAGLEQARRFIIEKIVVKPGMEKYK